MASTSRPRSRASSSGISLPEIRDSAMMKLSVAVTHAELAIGRRVEHVAVVGENGVLDSHRLEDALDLAGVADGVAVETADEVDFLVGLALQLGRSSGLAVPEMLDDSLQRVVIAGDMAADEGGRMREWHVVFGWH